MVVLVTRKNEEDPINNECDKVVNFPIMSLLYVEFSSHSMTANSAVRCPIWPNFELIHI